MINCWQLQDGVNSSKCWQFCSGEVKYSGTATQDGFLVGRCSVQMLHMISALLCLHKSTIYKHSSSSSLCWSPPTPPHLPPPVAGASLSIVLGPVCRQPSVVGLWACEVADWCRSTRWKSPQSTQQTHKHTRISRRTMDCKLSCWSPITHGPLMRSTLLFVIFSRLFQMNSIHFESTITRIVLYKAAEDC